MNGEARRLFRDSLAGFLTRGAGLLPCAVLIFIVLGLAAKSRPLVGEHSLFTLLFSSEWRPYAGKFGLFSFIAGTVYITALAVFMAVPPSILSALYLSEYAGKKIRVAAQSVLDILSAIPSVVYGLWGVVTVVPFIKYHAAPFFNSASSGYCLLSGGIVLAVMIIPVITQVSFEVLRGVPGEMKEASLLLGATRWNTIKAVVLRKAMPGLLAGVFLGVSRAFGETMAVLMLAGNVAEVPRSVWGPAYPLPALMANNYGEMLSIPGYEAALLFSALVLLSIVLFFQILSRICLIKLGGLSK